MSKLPSNIPTWEGSRFRHYPPSAYDSSMSVYEELVMIREYLNHAIINFNELNGFTQESIDWMIKEIERFEGNITDVVLPENLVKILNEWFENGKLAEIINEQVFGMKANKVNVDRLMKIVISIEEFPRLEGETDDTLRIQRAIDSLEGIGGTIYFEAKTYYIDQIKLVSYVRLEGVGKTTQFRAIDMMNKPMFVLKKNTGQMVELVNFMIDGNRLNQCKEGCRGVEFIGTTSYQDMINDSLVNEHDTRHLFKDLYIRETLGDGIYIEGRGESQMQRVETLKCDGNGIVLAMADCFHSYVSAGDSGLTGIVITPKATNNVISTSKSWYSGRLDKTKGDGFSVEAVRVRLVGCEAQDNQKHGFVFKSKDAIGQALIAEANGWYQAGSGPIERVNDSTGFLFLDAENCVVDGVCCDRFSDRTPSDPRQNYGLQLLGTTKNNIVRITSRNAIKGAIPLAQLTSGLKNDYEIVDIALDGSVKNWNNKIRQNLNIVDVGNASASYVRSLESLGHQIGSISRLDGDTKKVVQRLEKYGSDGATKVRVDTELDELTKTVTHNIIDGKGHFIFNQTLRAGLEGEWDKGHLMIGGVHVWREGSRLRAKTSNPTSEIDGVVVVEMG